MTPEDIAIVSEWLNYNSYEFTIPGGEWGISLYNALQAMLGEVTK